MARAVVRFWPKRSRTAAVLASKAPEPKQNRMTAPGIQIQFLKALYHTRPERIKMDVSDQLQQVCFFFADN